MPIFSVDAFLQFSKDYPKNSDVSVKIFSVLLTYLLLSFLTCLLTKYCLSF